MVSAKLLAVVFVIFLILAPSVQEAILRFVIGGVVPGTSYVVSSYVMFFSLIICLLAVIAWLSRQSFYLQADVQPQKAARVLAAQPAASSAQKKRSPAEKRRLANRSA